MPSVILTRGWKTPPWNSRKGILIKVANDTSLARALFMREGRDFARAG